METNPYEAPRTRLDETEEHRDALLLVRLKHLSTETNIRVLGGLDALAGASALAVSFGTGLMMIFSRPSRALMAPIFASNTLLSALLLYAAYGLVRLRPTGRFAQAAVFALFTYGVVGVDARVGLGITVFWAVLFVGVLLTPSARVVFSPAFRNTVVPSTPTVSWVPSLLLRLGCLCLTAVALFGPLYATFRAH